MSKTITKKENSYDYSDVDITKICNYLDVMVEDCKTKLKQNKKQDYFK